MSSSNEDLNARVGRIEQSIEHISEAIVKLADVQVKLVEIEAHTGMMRERLKSVEQDGKELRTEMNEVKTSAIVNKVKITAIVTVITLIGSALVTASARYLFSI